MAVDLLADAVAGIEVAWGGRSDAIPGHHVVDGRPLEAGEWFSDVVTELGIKGERTHVIAGLYQAHTRETLLRGAMMDVLHQLSPDRFVLDAGIDSNRPDTSDAVTFVKEVAADYLAAKFGHDGVETGVTQHRSQDVDRHVNRGEVRREMMCLRDRLERLLADRATNLRVLHLAAAKCKIHKLFQGLAG